MNIVTLLEELVNGLIAAEDSFFQNPKDFYSLEKSVKSTTEAFSAAFLGNVLTSMNEKIYEDGWRKRRYTAQRTDNRMLISSVGDITLRAHTFAAKQMEYTTIWWKRYSDSMQGKDLPKKPRWYY